MSPRCRLLVASTPTRMPRWQRRVVGRRGWARISAIACAFARSVLWGGKSRLGAGAAAGGPQAADER